MRCIFALLMVSLLAIGSPLAAQDTNSACTSALVNDTVSSANGLLEEANEQFASNQDSTTLATTLADVVSQLRILQANCTGLSFTGRSNTVLGPIDFPDGTYRVQVTTDGFFIASIEQLGGTCETRLSDTLFLLTAGGATQGAETTFTTSGCSALIAIDNATSSWTLNFENVSPSEELTASSNSQDSNSGAQDLQYDSAVEGFLFANLDAEHFLNGTEGDRITIGAIRTSGTADLALQLYAPNGTLLFEDDDSHPEGFLNPQISSIPLPVTGLYRVVVTRCSFCDSADSAAYTLSVRSR
jgi:hypothetical protein